MIIKKTNIFMIIYFIFNFFVFQHFCFEIFIDNNYNGTFQDGSYQSPFSSLDQTLNSSSLQNYFEISLILLSNSQNYTINNSFTLNSSVKIIYHSENLEKAGLILYFDKFIINGKVIFIDYKF